MTESKKIDTVLFDFDGTIMDTNEVIIESWQHSFKELTGEEGDIEKILDTFGEPLELSIGKLLPKFDMQEVLAVYREYQHKNYEEMIALFPGVQELIDSLSKSGYKLGVVTNRLRYTTDIGMKKYNLDKVFGSVIACHEAPRNKPFADPILLAIEQLGSTPETTMLVGDSANDILSGKNAEVVTVRVAWAMASDGSHDEKEVKPDYTIDTPEELVQILKEI